jgi:hypothetical protein
LSAFVVQGGVDLGGVDRAGRVAAESHIEARQIVHGGSFAPAASVPRPRSPGPPAKRSGRMTCGRESRAPERRGQNPSRGGDLHPDIHQRRVRSNPSPASRSHVRPKVRAGTAEVSRIRRGRSVEKEELHGFSAFSFESIPRLVPRFHPWSNSSCRCPDDTARNSRRCPGQVRCEGNTRVACNPAATRSRPDCTEIKVSKPGEGLVPAGYVCNAPAGAKPDCRAP